MVDNDWVKMETSSSPTWDYKAGKVKEVVGVLKEIKSNVGPNNSMLFVLETKEGDLGVWGTGLLTSRLGNLPLGEEVKIVYLGMAKSEKTGRNYHNFDVFHKPQARS